VTDRTWSIGELAAEFDTTLRTIRFYEDRGLLAPERIGTTRIFSDRERVRLQLILRGKRLGFTLSEIAHVLNLYDEQPGERGQLEFLIADIERRRSALEDKRRDLDEALAELAALEERCRADLAALAPETTREPARRSRPAARSRPTDGAPRRARSTAGASSR
jgi:DNA-binding transcriptional MerR regulator